MLRRDTCIHNCISPRSYTYQYVQFLKLIVKKIEMPKGPMQKNVSKLGRKFYFKKIAEFGSNFYIFWIRYLVKICESFNKIGQLFIK